MRTPGLALVLALACSCSKSAELRVGNVDPAQGTVNGNEQVVVRGAGFVPGKTSCTVKFGKTEGSNVTIQSETAIAVTTPGHERGAVDVTLVFDDGRAFTIPKGFTYIEPSTDRARDMFLANPSGKAAGGSVAPAPAAPAPAAPAPAPAAPAPGAPAPK